MYGGEVWRRRLLVHSDDEVEDMDFDVSGVGATGRQVAKSGLDVYSEERVWRIPDTVVTGEQVFAGLAEEVMPVVEGPNVWFAVYHTGCPVRVRHRLRTSKNIMSALTMEWGCKRIG